MERLDKLDREIKNLKSRVKSMEQRKKKGGDDGAPAADAAKIGEKPADAAAADAKIDKKPAAADAATIDETTPAAETTPSKVEGSGILDGFAKLLSPETPEQVGGKRSRKGGRKRGKSKKSRKNRRRSRGRGRGMSKKRRMRKTRNMRRRSHRKSKKQYGG